MQHLLKYLVLHHLLCQNKYRPLASSPSATPLLTDISKVLYGDFHPPSPYSMLKGILQPNTSGRSILTNYPRSFHVARMSHRCVTKLLVSIIIRSHFKVVKEDGHANGQAQSSSRLSTLISWL